MKEKTCFATPNTVLIAVFLGMQTFAFAVVLLYAAIIRSFLYGGGMFLGLFQGAAAIVWLGILFGFCGIPTYAKADSGAISTRGWLLVSQTIPWAEVKEAGIVRTRSGDWIYLSRSALMPFGAGAVAKIGQTRGVIAIRYSGESLRTIQHYCSAQVRDLRY